MPDHPNLASALHGLTYPASKAQIVAKATENRADAEVMAAVNALPDRTYSSEAEVNAA